MTSLFMRRLVAVVMFFALSVSLLATAAAVNTPTPDPHHPTQTTSPLQATQTMQGNPCDVSAASTPADHSMMGGTPSAGAMSKDFDLMFIDMMIPHHQAAIAMANIALVRGEHPEIRDLAQQIILSQGTEITLMKAWRDMWYPGAAAMPMDQMVTAMGGMMGAQTASTGSMGTMSGMGSTMDPAGEMQSLCSATGSFDEAFLQMMIPHHESAVAMAEVALQKGTHPDLVAMAKGLIYSQGKEIGQMTGWLASWYGATPAAG